MKSVKIGCEKLLPFNEKEKLFIKNIKEIGSIEPELFIHDEEMRRKIKIHPALLWAVKGVLL